MKAWNDKLENILTFHGMYTSIFNILYNIGNKFISLTSKHFFWKHEIIYYKIFYFFMECTVQYLIYYIILKIFISVWFKKK